VTLPNRLTVSLVTSECAAVRAPSRVPERRGGLAEVNKRLDAVALHSEQLQDLAPT